MSSYLYKKGSGNRVGKPRFFPIIVQNQCQFLMAKVMRVGCFFCLSLCALFSFEIAAQTEHDSVKVMEEVIVEGYPDKIPLLKSPVSVGILEKKQLENQQGTSLVPAMNTIAGVRMEERSPGSFRLSVRGSLIRSPFGIRNVKIYLDDFLLTDAGGNSYLNLLDAGSLKKLEILKGPQGSLYGANTGGVLLVQPFERAKGNGWHAQASTMGGSYNLFHEKIELGHQSAKNKLGLYQAYQYSGGYRENSAMERKYVQLTDVYDYNTKGKLKFFGFVSDLKYQTPGALTLSEFQHDPSAARPRSGKLAGAVQQQARVLNTTEYGGISHEYKLGNHLKHMASVFATYSDFRNPTINNYEFRKETTFGTRTYLELYGEGSSRLPQWKWDTGIEWQKTDSRVEDDGNRNGIPDTVQSSDEVNARQYFLFTQFSASWKKWHLEAGVSFNHANYQYRSVIVNPLPNLTTHTFDPQWMPRMALAFQLLRTLYWRGSASKGYSPPTIAEIRPSDNTIHTSLQPEIGWNFETGFRYQDTRILADLGVFYYNLQNTIVSRTNAAGIQYFTNSGSTLQPGLEWQFAMSLLKSRPSGVVRAIDLGNSVTYYQFSFKDYQSNGIDYSGNKLTGVPQSVVVSSLTTQFGLGFSLYIQYNYTAKIPLNDANSAFAPDYHLVQVKGSWKHKMREKYQVEVFAGTDNVLNARYSLGNDLNAAGGRYYNAAPLRNFYLGASFSF